MKGVVLCGGLGTRLRPLTLVTNKHLLPVYDKPMVFRPLETLTNAGIKEVKVIVGGQFAGDFIRILKNGDAFGFSHLEYGYQENEGGIAQALSLAEKFAAGENLAVILGDNCTDANISTAVKKFKSGALIFLKQVPDPQRFGVATVAGKQVVKIVEKPASPESNLAVTGLYLYDQTVFTKIKQLEPSSRGELEITDVNNLYLKENNLNWAVLPGFWRDAGTFATLFEVNDYWSKKDK